jgi:hypothetical protein
LLMISSPRRALANIYFGGSTRSTVVVG